MPTVLETTRPTWIEIDRQALAVNLQHVRRTIGPNPLLMAVVKANAYGHGAPGVARELLAAGADRFAVATLGEAQELRAAGIQAPILVLGYTEASQAALALRERLATTVFDLATAQVLNRSAATAQTPATVHVKVNTGMNRLGIAPDEAVDFLAALHDLPHLHVEGIFTHFATSDEIDKRHALAQFATFQAVLDRLEEAGLRPPIAHAANSAATLTLPETHLEMVRCGIALYGLHPDVQQARLPSGFLPVLQWKARVAQVRALRPGDAVSYGREFVASEPMMVATIPVGYADGFPRRPIHWGSVLIHGEFAPILGRVCMDQTVVDVTAIAAKRGSVRQADEVVLIGRQGDAELSAEEVGERLCTINYDVVSRILARVPRVMV